MAALSTTSIAFLTTCVGAVPAPGASPPAPTSVAPDQADVVPTSPEPTGFSENYEAPFPSENLELSAVLKEAIEKNLALRLNVMDVEISESRVLAALGAYDVFLTAGINGNLSRSPQRGSQFTVSTGSRTLSGFVGFRRALETGGELSLQIDASRNLTDQPISFFDPTAGSAQISSYRVAPTLTLNHPLLKGAGLKVNRADINRTKIATSTAEASRQITAESIVRDLVTAYWDLLFAARDLDNKSQSVELAQRQLDRTRALVAAGRMAPVDAKAVEQSLATRESEVLLAENTLLDASVTLRALMGQQFVDRKVLGITPVTDPVVLVQPVDVDAEIQRGLENNPQVRQIELALASRRIDELEAANQRLPQLDFSGSFTPQGRSVDTVPNPSSGDPGRRGNWGEAFRNFFTEDVGRDGLLADWTVQGSLTLTWDVQNRGPRGSHEAALGEIRKANLNLTQIRQTVATSVIRSANTLRTAAKRMDVTRISQELAEDNLKAEQARFEVGRSTNFDVLQRLDERDQAAADALSAQIEYLKARIQLQSLNGKILPAFGVDLT